MTNSNLLTKQPKWSYSQIKTERGYSHIDIPNPTKKRKEKLLSYATKGSVENRISQSMHFVANLSPHTCETPEIVDAPYLTNLQNSVEF